MFVRHDPNRSIMDEIWPSHLYVVRSAHEHEWADPQRVYPRCCILPVVSGGVHEGLGSIRLDFFRLCVEATCESCHSGGVTYSKVDVSHYLIPGVYMCAIAPSFHMPHLKCT